MKIAIADAQSRVRFGLKILLEQQTGWLVTGEAADGQDLLEITRRSCPDLILLDWDLPDGPVDALIRALRAQCPRLLLLAMSGKQGVGPAALKAGADGFTSKMESPENLLSLIHSLCPCQY